MLQQVQCPHCQAENTSESAFCQSCGKALPMGGGSGPQLVTGAATATTSAGRVLQSDELRKTANKAAGALIAVAIVQLIAGALLYFAGAALAKEGQEFPMIAVVMVIGVGIVFLGLFFWARVNPLPAAIVGLVLYGTVFLLDVIADPASLGRGIVIKIIIVGALVQAISAGLKYRRLQEEARRG